MTYDVILLWPPTAFHEVIDRRQIMTGRPACFAAGKNRNQFKTPKYIKTEVLETW